MENEKYSEIYGRWLANQAGGKPRFIAFVDGDPVEQGDDYNLVAVNAIELRSQRGSGAELVIFDSDSGNPIPQNA